MEHSNHNNHNEHNNLEHNAYVRKSDRLIYDLEPLGGGIMLRRGWNHNVLSVIPCSTVERDFETMAEFIIRWRQKHSCSVVNQARGIVAAATAITVIADELC